VTTPRPIGGSSAWLGPELIQSSALSSDVEASLRASLSARAEGSATERDEARIARRSSKLAAQLESGPGVALLRGLDPRASDDTLRGQFRALCAALGAPLSQSSEGALSFEVRDLGHGPDDPRTRGPNSARALSFHSDRCDVIGFLCLSPAARGGATYVASASRIHDRMLTGHPELVAELYRPLTWKRHNVDLHNPLPFYQQAVFGLEQGHFACCLMRVLIDRADADPGAPTLTSRQRAALDLIEGLARDPSVHARLMLRRGEVLLINNFVALHARDAYHDGAAPRRLERVWLAMPNSRPLPPSFAGHYRETRAGQPRGGFQARDRA
jgi:hypothetical protein